MTAEFENSIKSIYFGPIKTENRLKLRLFFGHKKSEDVPALNVFTTE